MLFFFKFPFFLHFRIRLLRLRPVAFHLQRRMKKQEDLSRSVFHLRHNFDFTWRGPQLGKNQRRETFFSPKSLLFYVSERQPAFLKKKGRDAAEELSAVRKDESRVVVLFPTCRNQSAKSFPLIRTPPAVPPAECLCFTGGCLKAVWQYKTSVVQNRDWKLLLWENGLRGFLLKPSQTHKRDFERPHILKFAILPVFFKK